uniref:Uncharacterized protein n=1 Tax=Glossina brevipalpis TaxID=37001 RepID=A0A1A9W8J5_9MUSC
MVNRSNNSNNNNNGNNGNGGNGPAADAAASVNNRRNAANAAAAAAAEGAAAAEWVHEDMDHFSFDDSDRFEEDSLCSWSSEPESLYNNWRGWKKPSNYGLGNGSTTVGAADVANNTRENTVTGFKY